MNYPRVERTESITTIPAQPGCLGLIPLNDERGYPVGLHAVPIIAWHMLTTRVSPVDFNHVVQAVTHNGDTPDLVELPDGTVEYAYVETFSDRDAALASLQADWEAKHGKQEQ